MLPFPVFQAAWWASPLQYCIHLYDEKNLASVSVWNEENTTRAWNLPQRIFEDFGSFVVESRLKRKLVVIWWNEELVTFRKKNFRQQGPDEKWIGAFKTQHRNM